MAEPTFLNEVSPKANQYHISSKDRSNIKQQLLEHIQESRELGKDSIKELGNSHELVKDFLEINGIDLHSEIKQIRKSKSRTGILFVIGFFTLILSYLGSQLIFSMFLQNPLTRKVPAIDFIIISFFRFPIIHGGIPC